MENILVIDDDPGICDAITSVVTRMGHKAVCAMTLKDGIQKVKASIFDVVLLDVKLPDGDGLEALPMIQKYHPGPEVIIMTGYGDADGAELAIINGAWDYLQKPVSVKGLRLALSRALQYQKEKQRRSGPRALKLKDIMGNSPALRKCLDLVANAAAGDINVLITGETGTGKELFAAAIHENSPRSEERFVVVDCAALPNNLVESVLFGHEKGAYTGADRNQDGLVLQADGGTLFLDEVGELPLEIQKTFLRVLQEKSFRPVGSKVELKSDFRLIAATNKSLDDLVKQGGFREDLIFRLRALSIELPPLRERKEDIKILALHHISRMCDRYKIETKGFSPDFFEMLSLYSWPGNVRELNQALESALTSAGPNPVLFPKDLPAEIRAKVVRDSVGDGKLLLEEAAPDHDLPPMQDARSDAIAQVEKRYLQRLVQQSSGDIAKACRISGLSRSRLYTLLKKYGIPSK